jgi:hypothetical protein
VTGWGELHGYPIGVAGQRGRHVHAGRDPEGGPLHPARQRHRHHACCSCSTRARRPPRSGRRPTYGTAPRCARGGQVHRPAPDVMIGGTPPRTPAASTAGVRAAVPVQLAGRTPRRRTAAHASCPTTA